MTPPVHVDSGIDAHWMATAGTMATWSFALYVEGAMQDAQAAHDSGDTETTAECIVRAFEYLVHCELALEGYSQEIDEPALLLAMAEFRPELLDELDRLAPTADAGAAELDRGLADLVKRFELLRDKLPIELPEMRKPTGFFPSVRIARELSTLRQALGMPPFEWNWNI